MVFNVSSLSVQRNIIDWIKLVCSKAELNRNTNHLAVKLLDYFMEDYNIADWQLRFVVFGCIVVAAKLEDISTSVMVLKRLELSCAVCGLFKLLLGLEVETRVL